MWLYCDLRPSDLTPWAVATYWHPRCRRASGLPGGTVTTCTIVYATQQQHSLASAQHHSKRCKGVYVCWRWGSRAVIMWWRLIIVFNEWALAHKTEMMMIWLCCVHFDECIASYRVHQQWAVGGVFCLCVGEDEDLCGDNYIFMRARSKWALTMMMLLWGIFERRSLFV